MAGTQKRKGGPHDGQSGGSAKRSKGGSGNRKWTTAQHDARRAEKLERGEALAVGDQGIWVSFVRGMDLKAMREFKRVCYEYGEEMYGIKAPGEPGDKEAKDHDDEDDDEPGDIEASINKELESFKNKPKPATREVFTIVKADLECLFFVKTMEPVDPTELVRRILQDARNCSGPGERKLRYINRLTPIVDTDRSTESGILKVARSVMAPHFLLKPEDASAVAEKEGEADRAKAEDKEDKEPKENDDSHPTYAIRPSLRNFKNLRSMEVINKIAAIVRPEHKVNLTSPGKVVLVEIFQLFCGVSVVDGEEWERLKRYNVNELYRLAFEDAGPASESGTTEKADQATKSED